MWAVFPPGISIGTAATKSVLEEAVVKSRPPRDVNPNILAAGVCVGRGAGVVLFTAHRLIPTCAL